MVRFQQQLSFNKALSTRQLIKMLIDPMLIIVMLYSMAIINEGKLASHYIVLSILAFTLSFPGSWRGTQNIAQDMIVTFRQWFLIVGILFFFGYATNYLYIFTPNVILIWVLTTPFFLLAAHWFLSQYLSSQYYISQVKRTAIIIGNNELSKQLKSRIMADKEVAIELKGFFDDIASNKSALLAETSKALIGNLEQIADYVRQHAIDIIYITLPPSMHAQIMLLLDDLKDTTASIYFVPDFFMADLIQGRIDEIDGLPVVAVCETPFTGYDGFIKRLSDIVIASTLLILLLPILMLIALGVKLSSPGPVLFNQRRYGLDGQEIIVYKFRSMTVTENGANVIQATANDARVTKFGKFIRKTSLDELPQFINVLQGRMSVVGPRPHAVTHNEMYRKLIKGYMIRHKVKPGITGWAQVNGYRGETKTVDSMKSRIDYDLEYLKKWSLLLDLSIIIKTIFLIFKDSKAY